jgi:hypothetical protein
LSIQGAPDPAADPDLRQKTVTDGAPTTRRSRGRVQRRRAPTLGDARSGARPVDTASAACPSGLRLAREAATVAAHHDT